MFADNQMISGRQCARLLFLIFSGSGRCCCRGIWPIWPARTAFCHRFGGGGIPPVPEAAARNLFWAGGNFSGRQRETGSVRRRTACWFFSTAFTMCCWGGYALYLFGSLIQRTLLTEESFWLIALLGLLLAAWAWPGEWSAGRGFTRCSSGWC